MWFGFRLVILGLVLHLFLPPFDEGFVSGEGLSSGYLVLENLVFILRLCISLKDVLKFCID